MTIKLPDDSYVPAGTEGRMDDGSDFVVGYDGQAFLDNLKSANSATIALASGACRIAFDFAPTIGEQARVGPLPCQPVVAGNRAVAFNSLALRRWGGEGERWAEGRHDATEERRTASILRSPRAAILLSTSSEH